MLSYIFFICINKFNIYTLTSLKVSDLDMFDWPTQSTEMQQLGPMMVDEDYMDLMSDTLFSTITSNQPFAFPDTREIGWSYLTSVVAKRLYSKYIPSLALYSY